MKKILLALTLLLAGPLWAEEPFIPVWLNQGALLSPQELQPILAQLAAQKPAHIVVLVHGYGVVREETTEPYREVANRVHHQFRQFNLRSSVLGVQWESAVAGSEWPWEMEGAYFSMLSRARGLGQAGLRQLLLATHKKLPGAQIDLLTHSLGCEVGTASLYPGLNYHDDGTPTLPAYDPKSKLNVNFWGLLASDLDYDVWHKTGVNLSGHQPLMWMTIASYTGDRDRALMLRKFTRGWAGGTALPRMTKAQYDTEFKNRQILFDGRDLGQQHSFSDYLSPARLTRMISAAAFKANPSLPKPGEVAEVDRILALPPKVDAIRLWLDSGNLSSQIYALWRMEHILCGGSQHFEDETIEKVARLMRNTPAKVKAECKDSPCVSIQKGYWPTQKQRTAAGAPNW